MNRIINLHNAVAELALTPERADPSTVVTALKHGIDARVYRLNGLTKDEIKLVEESVQK